jgi:DNA polymerase III delta prime subunit
MGDPGRDSYRGFHYQIRVSAWLAAVFLREGGRDAVVIEPLGGEDLLALDPASGVDTADRTIECVAGDIVVQVKSRKGGSWGNEEFGPILTGKDPATKKETRVRPLTTLEDDPAARFLFVTEAAVDANLLSLVVDTPLFAPRPVPQGKLTATLKDKSDPFRGRIGIIPLRSPSSVDLDALEVLVHKWLVPRLEVEACHARLLERIREGLRDRQYGALAASELRDLVRDFHGEPEEPETFTPPASFDDLRATLEKRHALLLVGKPGVGKTEAARQLLYEHRRRAEPFAVAEPKDPHDLESQATRREPLLVYVEDPFGRDRHEEVEGTAWAGALERFLRHTTSSRRLLVTSRDGFASPHVDNGHTPRLNSARRTLSVDGYDRGALLTVTMDREPGLEHAARAWIETFRERIVETLDRPICFERLVARAAHVPPEDRTRKLLAKFIDDAVSVGFGMELEKTFHDRPEHEIRGLVALWIGLHVWRGSDAIATELEVLEGALGDTDIDVVVRRLLQYRWLRSVRSRLTMHPSYESACLEVAVGQRSLSRATVERIVDILLARSKHREAWTAWNAAHGTKIAARSAITDRLRVAARAVLVDPASSAREFRTSLEFLGRAAHPDNLLDSFVAVVQTTVAAPFQIGQYWQIPKWSNNELDAAAADSDVARLVRRFVRDGLPTAPSMLDKEDSAAFAAFLYRLADVSTEFDGLLERIDDRRPEMARSIAAGVVRSRNADRESLVARAVAIEKDVEKWWAGIVAEGDDDNDGYWEHFGSVRDDMLAPAEALIDALLDERARVGYPDWAATRTENLVFARFAERARWTEHDLDIIRRVMTACPKQLRAQIALDMTYRSRPNAWDAVRVLDLVAAHSWRRVLEHLFRYASDAEPETLAVLASFARALEPFERVALGYEFGDGGAIPPAGAALLSVSTPTERSALVALRVRPQAIRRDALSLLEAITRSDHSAAADAAWSLSAIGLRTTATISSQLERSPPALKRAYLRLLASLFGDLTEGDEARGLARRLLADANAEVRAAAVAALAPDESEIDAVAAVSLDRSASVRAAVAKAISGRSHPTVIWTLVRLLRDSADTSDTARHGWSGEDYVEYGVAEAAAEALAAVDPWTQEIIAAVEEFLSSNVPTARDSTVRSTLSAAMPAALP